MLIDKKNQLVFEKSNDRLNKNRWYTVLCIFAQMLFMAGKTRIGSHQNFDPSLLVATQKTLTDFREDEASTQKKGFSRTQILNILHQTFRENSFLLILAVNSPYLRPDNHIGWVKPTPLHQRILFIQGLIPEILIYVHLLHDINSPIPQFTNPRFLLCLLSRCVWLLLFRLCNTNANFFSICCLVDDS